MAGEALPRGPRSRVVTTFLTCLNARRPFVAVLLATKQAMKLQIRADCALNATKTLVADLYVMQIRAARTQCPKDPAKKTSPDVLQMRPARAQCSENKDSSSASTSSIELRMLAMRL